MKISRVSLPQAADAAANPEAAREHIRGAGAVLAAIVTQSGRP